MLRALLVLIAFAPAALAQELIGHGSFDEAAGRLFVSAEVRGYSRSGGPEDFFLQTGIMNVANDQSVLIDCRLFDALSAASYSVDVSTCEIVSSAGRTRIRQVVGSLSRELGSLDVEAHIKGLVVTTPQDIEFMLGLGNSATGEFVMLQQPAMIRTPVSEPGVLSLLAIAALAFAICRAQGIRSV